VHGLRQQVIYAAYTAHAPFPGDRWRFTIQGPVYDGEAIIGFATAQGSPVLGALCLNGGFDLLSRMPPAPKGEPARKMPLHGLGFERGGRRRMSLQVVFWMIAFVQFIPCLQWLRDENL